MNYCKFNNDGTIQHANKQHEGFIDGSLFAKDADGEFYTYYLSTPDVDGKYQPDMDKEQEAIDLAEALVVKETKVKALEELVVTHETVAYDANGRAIGNMSAVMGVCEALEKSMLAVSDILGL